MEGVTLSLGLLQFTLHTYLIMLGIYEVSFFLVFGMTQPGMERRSRTPLANKTGVTPRLENPVDCFCGMSTFMDYIK